MSEFNLDWFPAKVTAEGEIIPLDDFGRMVESLDNYAEPVVVAEEEIK